MLRFCLSVSLAKEERKWNVIYVHASEHEDKEQAGGRIGRESEVVERQRGGTHHQHLPLFFFPNTSLDLLIHLPPLSPDCLPLSLSAVAVVLIMGPPVGPLFGILFFLRIMIQLLQLVCYLA